MTFHAQQNFNWTGCVKLTKIVRKITPHEPPVSSTALQLLNNITGSSEDTFDAIGNI